MPFVLGFILWYPIPALTATWTTFTEWNLIRPPRYVGYDNSAHLGSDKLFWQSLKVTTLHTAAAVPPGLVLYLFHALLINTKVEGIAFYRNLLPDHHQHRIGRHDHT